MNVDLREMRSRVYNINREMRSRFQDLDSDGRWFDIANKAGDDDEPAEIRIYGTIGGWFGDITAAEFVEELDEITADEIIVSISSKGGDVFDGIAIYNALRQHSAHITTKADSMVASIASVIMQAGDHRVMVTGSQMMIHKAWGIVMGNDDELRAVADMLALQDSILAGIYESRTDEDKAYWLEKMNGELWLDADSTIDIGLADELIDPPLKKKEETKARNTTRFSEQIAAVLTDVVKLTERAEGVAAFRTENGKPALAEDSIEALELMVALLTDAVAPVEPEPNDSAAGDRITNEYLRFVAVSIEG